MKYYLLILFLFLLSSCTQVYYAPITKNIPLFKEKNEYRASFDFGMTDEMYTTDFQAAYSITDHFAVSTSLMFGRGGGDTTNFGEGTYYDFALGYYKPLRIHGVFEIFGGIGKSSQHHVYVKSTSTYSGSYSDLGYTSIFIQPSIGLTLNGFDIAFTSGFSRVNFHRIVDNTSTYDEENKSVLSQISNHKSSILFEPAVTIRVGWKYVKLELQGIHPINLSHSYLPFDDKKIIIGLQFAFAERYNQKRIKK